jgi:hypothetical protein
VNRVRTLVFAIVPSLLAAGFLLSSEAGHAETGRAGGVRAWSSSAGSVIVAQNEPREPRTPRPPRAPAPPRTPAPPMPPIPPAPGPQVHVPGRGVSISIRDGKIEIEGIAETVSAQLDSVLRALDHMPNVEPEARDRVKSRVKAVRAKIKARLQRLKSMDLDRVGAEVERIGDELEKEMEGVDKDLEQLSEKLAKHFSEKFGRDFGRDFAKAPRLPGPDHSDGADDPDDEDDEDDEDAVLPPSLDIDPSDLQDRIAALKNLTLTAEQKQKLARLRADSQQQVEVAKRDLERMSSRLRDSLGDGSAKEADIERQIDRISEKEATIRKARLLTWLKVRNLLSEDQRKVIEAATRKQ